MDRRRMMMTGGKPLVVFSYGDTKLNNVTNILRRNKAGNVWAAYNGIRFEDGKFIVDNSTPSIVMFEIPLKKYYKKLFVEASSKDSGSEGAEFFNAYISWSTAEKKENYNMFLIDDGNNRKVYELDISARDKDSGMFYLYLWESSFAGANFDVFNIWFE